MRARWTPYERKLVRAILKIKPKELAGIVDFQESPAVRVFNLF